MQASLNRTVHYIWFGWSDTYSLHSVQIRYNLLDFHSAYSHLFKSLFFDASIPLLAVLALYCTLLSLHNRSLKVFIYVY